MTMMKDFIEIVGCTPPSGLTIDSKIPHVQFGIEETLTIPPVKPDIEQIIKLMIDVDITDFRVIETVLVHDCKRVRKVVLEGVIREKILYVAARPEQPVHAAHFDNPFCNFIVIPECFDADRITGVKIICEDAHLKMMDPRTIKKCLVLLAWLEMCSMPCPPTPCPTQPCPPPTPWPTPCPTTPCPAPTSKPWHPCYPCP